ncbi:hypothetical protein F5Y15DRAFT_374850 [Xylariaceae sp. FL0016]|nr:hypothetical protein F5Y15DRAFT_374850 [Xylariaceae sp. FL0016]
MGWMWSTPSASRDGSTPSSNTSHSKSPDASVPKPAGSQYSDPEVASFMAQITADFGGSGSSNPTTTQSTTTSPPTQEATPVAPKSESAAAAPKSSSSWSGFWSSKTSPPTTSEPTSTSQRTITTPPTTSISQNSHPSSSSSSSSAPQDAEPRLDPLSEALLPTTMSCRAAFDHAFHCNSVGGQWTSVFREGTMRTCSAQWDDFWFCMRTRTKSPERKAEEIRDYYRAKELAKYGPGKPASTDVWEARADKVPPGTAFTARYDMPDVSDEEWWRLEIERRRAVQKMLSEERDSS